MSRHDDMVSMRHMLDHAAEAMEMARGRCREDLDRDRKLSLALMRLLEVVGEAAGRVSPATRAAHSAVAWSKIIGLRNRLIHGYDQVDYDVLWRIIGEDLPPLVAELEREPA
jgi:uncharacterized protein with HEPN domain